MASAFVCEAVPAALEARGYQKVLPRWVSGGCRRCETPFGYLKEKGGKCRIHCSDECRDAERAEHRKRDYANQEPREFTCKRCGEVFESRQTVASFCSPECNNAHHSDLQRAKGKVIRAATTERRRHTCQQCGTEFVRRAYGKPGENKFCSPACGHAAKAKPLAPPPQATCEMCEQAFRPPTRHSKICSDTCRKALARKQYRETYQPVDKIVARDCAICGARFEFRACRGRGTIVCGTACKATLERGHRATRRARTRARDKAAAVENVNPYKVFHRDGWRCQLCRCKTPRAKRGTLEPNAPELDHIVPLSKGGEHSYRNTQCLCRACNQRKSDRDMGQLLLFG